ncbi:MAG: SLAC1 anion channel family protein [Ideonella sp.]|nr:SLAC1 anion channel family protein [Ideonella sp.]
MAHDPHPLKHLLPGWYAVVMGLSGLALAWHRAVPLMGEAAGVAAMGIGALAGLVFAVLAVATVLRAQRHPEAWADDRRHPVRHTFIAALPIAIILLATVAVALGGPSLPARALWWVGSLSQLFVTLWVLGRWWKHPKAGGLQWASATPALFIPIVGNVLVPLAGVPLGHAEWAAAQFGIGLMFWPVVMVLIIARVAIQGLWPDRMMPTTFIFIAPPAVVGLSSLQLGAPPLLGWILWGMALFSLLWVGTQAQRIAKLPFGLPHWGMSFPLAAMAALTLRLATPGSGLLAVLGPLLLALASLLILALVLGTVRGLRDGSLLAPEPVAAIVATAP